MDLLKKIIKMKQYELKKYLTKRLSSYYAKIESPKAYIYARGSLKVLLVAHLDTVYSKPPKKINVINNYIQSPDGIGGDDRCGVYIILKLLEKGLRPSVLFTTDEEIGGIGASEFTLDVDNLDVNFILQLDRRGKNDVVRYDDDNLDLTKFIETFGFKENYGTFSDISIIAPHYCISAVNLSCGYFNEHRGASEIIDFKVVVDVLNKVYKILKAPNEKKYIYKEHKYVYKYIYDDYLWDSNSYINRQKPKYHKYCKYCGLDETDAALYDIELLEDKSGFICEDCIERVEILFCEECGYSQNIDEDGYICLNCGNDLLSDSDFREEDDEEC